MSIKHHAAPGRAVDRAGRRLQPAIGTTTLPLGHPARQKAPIQVGPAELLSNVGVQPDQCCIDRHFTVGTGAGLITIAPVVIVFLFAQRQLVTGMTAGGTKE
jgi:multiple sugar transport system permease protein